MAKHAFTGEVIGSPGADRRETAACARASAENYRTMARPFEKAAYDRYIEVYNKVFRELYGNKTRVPEVLEQRAYRQDRVEQALSRDIQYCKARNKAAEFNAKASQANWKAFRNEVVASVQTALAKLGLNF